MFFFFLDFPQQPGCGCPHCGHSSPQGALFPAGAPRTLEPPQAPSCCITSDIKKAGRSPRVLLLAASELLSSAQISLFSFPKDGFSSFLQEQPCLAQGAAPGSSKASFTKPGLGEGDGELELVADPAPGSSGGCAQPIMPKLLALVTPSSSCWSSGCCQGELGRGTDPAQAAKPPQSLLKINWGEPGWAQLLEGP